MTHLFYTCDKLQHLGTIVNEELKLVFKYCNINNLSINLAKTNYMVISSPRLNGSKHIHNIKRGSQIKYLGVYNDQNLHWGSQIQHINNKLGKNVGIINKLRYYVDLHTLRHVFLLHLSIFNLWYYELGQCLLRPGYIRLKLNRIKCVHVLCL